MPAALKNPRSIIPILLVTGAVLFVPLAGHSQGSNPRLPGGDMEAQRTQQADQMQQQQQQYLRDQALKHATDDITAMQARMADEARERAHMRYIIWENFHRHYRVLRINAQKLVEMTSELQTYVENHPESSLSKAELIRTGKIEKLAHEIRDTMAGKRLPSVKSVVNKSDLVQSGGGPDDRLLLVKRTSEASASALSLQKAIDDYLAQDNEHTVSLDALKRTADKTQLDPHLVNVMISAIKVEGLAFLLRTDKRLLAAK